MPRPRSPRLLEAQYSSSRNMRLRTSAVRRASFKPSRCCDHVLLSVGDHDRLHRAEHLAEKAGHCAGGIAAGVIVAQHAPAAHLHEYDHAQQGQDHGQGDQRVDPEHDDYRAQEKGRVSQQIGQPGGPVGQLHHVAREPVEGIAGGDGQPLRARAAQHVLRRRWPAAAPSRSSERTLRRTPAPSRPRGAPARRPRAAPAGSTRPARPGPRRSGGRTGFAGPGRARAGWTARPGRARKRRQNGRAGSGSTAPLLSR